VRRGDPIPPLREDLETCRRRSGDVEVRDPYLLRVLTLADEDLRVARAFDGVADSDDLVDLLAERGELRSRHEVERIAAQLSALRLLDTPEVWDESPERDGASPWTVMDARAGLSRLPVAHPEARWACHGCGDCCHRMQVELTPAEIARIDAGLYRDLLGDEDFTDEVFLRPDEGPRRVLRQRAEDGEACIFLLGDGRCAVHARQGMAHKPGACQIFPLMVVHMPRRPPRLGVRVNCQSMHLSHADGPSLSAQASHALRVLQDEDVHRVPARLDLFGDRVPFSAYERLSDQLLAAVQDGPTAEALARVDRAVLGGRARRVRRRFGRTLLAHARGAGAGGYGALLKRVPRAWKALEAMAAGLPPPRLRVGSARLLGAQLRHVLYLCGPLHAPDAGVGLVALVLMTEATMHAVGPRGDPARTNRSFDVFTNPLLETLEHQWPILDAIDPRFAKRLRQEMSP
jgi:Fe-S-cluster containining protein